jgi:hypothetical protein
MFDVARLIALVWAVVVVARARARVEGLALVVALYFFALAVASGVTIRNEGPLEPMIALLLALVGPTSMPRGRLPSLPGANLVVSWPAIVNAVACVSLVALARRLGARIDELPESSLETKRLDRLGRALVLVAAFEGIAAGTRLLPWMLDWGWGGSSPIFESAPALEPK